eukprot:Hpha_TRINITY_DN12873_c0_g3::TRINITY_DN12873_c0_g3_i1::g.24326::m.24326
MADPAAASAATAAAGARVGAQALHISNLPRDTTARDLYWLYTTMPGFLCGVLKYDSTGGRAPIAFATFDSYQNAEVAMHASNGLPHNGGEAADSTSRLRVAMAREASTGAQRQDGHIQVIGAPVPPGGAAAYPGGVNPYAAAAAARYSPYPGAEAMYAAAPAGYDPHAAAAAGYDPHAAAAASYDAAFAGAPGGAAAYPGAVAPYPGGAPPGYPGGGGASMKNVGAPSTTLFVRSGRPAPYEFNSSMIENLFMRQAPLPQKVSVRGGRAWVKYGTVEEATQAMHMFQGYIGPETDAGSIEISFARSETKA